MDNKKKQNPPKKTQTIQGTQDEDTTQYALDATMRKQTHIT